MGFVLLLYGGGLFTFLVPIAGRLGGPLVVEYLPGEPRVDGGGGEVLETGVRAVLDQPDLYLLLLIVWYVTPAALANFAEEGRLRAGFNLKAIRKATARPRYLLSWTAFFVLWWLSFGAFLTWQLPLVGDLTLVDYGSSLLFERGAIGLGIEVGENLVAVSALVYFPLVVLAYAFVGAAWRDVRPTGTGGRAESEQVAVDR